MTFDEFSKANRTRCESPAGFAHTLDSWSLSDWLTATAGELGEAANIIKKLNRVRDGIPGNKQSADELRAALSDELADTFIYLDLLAQSQGVNLGEAVRRKFDAKSAEMGYPLRLTKPERVDVLSRPECVFSYCPHPEQCQIGCQQPAK